MSTWQRWLTASCVLVLGATATGCSGTGTADVEAVARRFYQALDDQNGAAACALLAPPTRTEAEQSSGQSCDQALLDEQVDAATGVPHIEVYGTMAQIRWAQETTFLTRYNKGWRVLAAGCSLEPGTTTGDTNDAADPERYQCTVQN